MTWKNCTTRPGPRGLTLVEVLAALTLVGGLLAGAVMANGRFTRQRAAAEDRQAAIEALDAMLHQWWQDPETIPIDEAGHFDDKALTWRTRQVTQPLPDPLTGTIVRVSVHPAEPRPSNPIVSVDLLVPERTERGRDE